MDEPGNPESTIWLFGTLAAETGYTVNKFYSDENGNYNSEPDVTETITTAKDGSALRAGDSVTYSPPESDKTYLGNKYTLDSGFSSLKINRLSESISQNIVNVYYTRGGSNYKIVLHYLKQNHIKDQAVTVTISSGLKAQVGDVIDFDDIKYKLPETDANGISSYKIADEGVTASFTRERIEGLPLTITADSKNKLLLCTL